MLLVACQPAQTQTVPAQVQTQTVPAQTQIVPPPLTVEATFPFPADTATPAAVTESMPTATEPVSTSAEAKPNPVAAMPTATEAEPKAGAYEAIDPSGQTVIFWHNHTWEREEELNKIVGDFNASNEWGITVVAEHQGSYNDIFDRMLGVLNTSDAPQLVVAYQNQAATYQVSEGLVDMNPMVNSPKWGLSEEEQTDFFPAFWAQDVFPTYGDARLGFPPNRSSEVLYYNVEWLKELGYDAPPKTPEDMKEMACKAVEQPFSKATAEGPMGYELRIDASRFASFTFAHGGDIYDYNSNQFTYDSAAAVAAMTFVQDLFNSGCAAIATENYGDQADFGAGKLLFATGSSSGLPFYEMEIDDGARFEWNVAPIPYTTSEPVMNIYGLSLSIPRTTPEGELAAWLFVRYYTSPDVQAGWAKASGYFPVRASVAEGMADYFAENPIYKTAFDLLEFGAFEPPVPGYEFVRIKVNEAMAAILDGADVASTLAILNEEANAILADQMVVSQSPREDSPAP
jgi:multiple sugar transport system substrate-binding protein/sn-glycerol 3-phosphate transport system substrate-binding protein